MALTGDLRNIGLADLFQTLHQNRATGMLEVINGDSRKSLLFNTDGISLASRRTLSGFRMGKRLVGLGRITAEELRDALDAQSRDGGLLGELLVAGGCCSEQDIQDVIRYHVEEELFELFTWTEGTFSFHEGSEPSKEELSGPYAAIAMEPGQAIFDAARRIDECQQAWDQLPTRPEILTPTSSNPKPLDEGTWDIESRAIFNLIDGVRTIGDILDEIFISEYDAVPLLVQLVNAGLIRKKTVSELTSTASILTVRGDQDGAVTSLKAALVDRPDDAEVLTNLCTAYQKMGDKAAAADVLQHIAQLRYGAQDFESAADLLTVAARYAPGSPEVHEQLAMVLSQGGDEAGAMAAYLSACEILNEQKRYDAAINLGALGLQLDPNDVKLRNNLANSYLGAGNTQAAAEQLIQVVPSVEASGSRRQIEDLYRRILQIDSSRREYMSRLERITHEGVLKRKRIKMASIVGAALLVLSALAVVMMPGGEDPEALLAKAWDCMGSEDLDGAGRIANQIIDAAPDSDAALQARNILASIDSSRQEAEGPKVAARTRLTETLGRLFIKADGKINAGQYGPGITDLLDAVRTTQSAETLKSLDFIGKRESNALLADCRKQAVEIMKSYVDHLRELIHTSETELAKLKAEKTSSGDIDALSKAFKVAERLRNTTNPEAHERNSAYTEEVESILCQGKSEQTSALLKAIDDLQRLNDDVTERYHTLRASVLYREMLSSFADLTARANDLKYEGRLMEAREICARYLAECDRLRTEQPAGYYTPVADELLGEDGHNLDGKMAAEMQIIDQVLGDLELAEKSIEEGSHEQANALMRSLIRNNYRIDFKNLVRLVLLVRTSPPGAEVTMSWNGQPEVPLGRTTEKGIVVRYPPHGPTVINIRKGTFKPITITIQDFTENYPSSPVYRLEKEIEWKATAVGPQQARPLVFGNSLLLAGRDGHIRTLDLETGTTGIDHDHGLLSGFAASPLLIDNVVWLACLDRKLVAFDLETRRVLHDIECGARLRTSPIRVGESVVVVDENGLVRAFRGGREEWNRSLPGKVISDPAATEHAIYVATSAGNIFALAPRTGEVRWSVDLGETVHSPLVLDPAGRPIIATDSGTVLMLGLEKGRELWRAQLDNAARGRPAVQNDVVWIGTIDGGIYSISLADGSVCARFSSLHDIAIERGPVLDEDRLYIIDANGKLGCLDLDGNLLWRVDLESPAATAPVTRDGRVYVATTTGAVYCFRR